jgi:hypothetical protein
MTATPKYYPAEDIKPAKAVYRVKQNVSVQENDHEEDEMDVVVLGMEPSKA